MPNQITGANAGGRRQLPMRTRSAARVGQFCRSTMQSTGELAFLGLAGACAPRGLALDASGRR